MSSNNSQTDQLHDSLELRSLLKASGEVELSLQTRPIGAPGPREVVVQVFAAPLHPADISTLLAGADPASFTESIDGEPAARAPVAPSVLRGLRSRQGESMAVGTEGAGVVVASGTAPEAKALLGRRVAVLCPGTLTQYRCVNAADCEVLPDGAAFSDGAAFFGNPLTVLGMIETMRSEGFTGIVHTAAASSVGQMLVRLCLRDNIPLVNIVRSSRQADLLRDLGATHVCDSSSASFAADLQGAIAQTGARLAFDAVGGGDLTSRILTAMERANTRGDGAYARYGSTGRKQAYIYGRLELGPTVLSRAYGVRWGVASWLVFAFLDDLGEKRRQALRARVAAELTTTFATSYSQVLSLRDVLRPQNILAYAKRATGEKYLVNPQI